MRNGIEWFRSQVTLAQWSLDAAVSAPVELGRAHRQRALQIYRALLQALPDSSLTREQRPEIDRALEEIRVRLQIGASGT